MACREDWVLIQLGVYMIGDDNLYIREAQEFPSALNPPLSFLLQIPSTATLHLLKNFLAQTPHDTCHQINPNQRGHNHFPVIGSPVTFLNPSILEMSDLRKMTPNNRVVAPIKSFMKAVSITC